MNTDIQSQALRRKYLTRKLLRGFTGAAMGLPLGGLLGYLLGGAFWLALWAITLLHTPQEPGPVPWGGAALAAAFGIAPGAPGGFLIGSLIIIPDGRRRTTAAVLLGLLAGIIYAMIWSGGFRSQPEILGSIVASGLLGGLAMAGVLSLLRRRTWWTRWEQDEDQAQKLSPPSHLGIACRRNPPAEGQ